MFLSRKKISFFRVAAAWLTMLCWGAAFSGAFPLAAKLFKHLPVIPAIMALGAAMAVIVLLTLLCGRFYCAILCPLGIMQDIFRKLTFRKEKQGMNLRKLRLAVTGVCTGMFAAGTAAGFLIFDPYSNSGRSSQIHLASGIIILLTLMIATLWKPRFFCMALCPAGTLLGMASTIPVIRLTLNGNCVKCGKCAAICPANAIDLPKGVIDNEACLRCLKCLQSCPLKRSGISFRFSRKKDLTDISKRKFLVNSGIFLGAAAIGTLLGKSRLIKLFSTAPKFKILPPGAGNQQRFTGKCTGCLLCAANCPAKIIVPAPGGIGSVSLDISKNPCRFDCNLCGQLCPSRAIIPYPLAVKQHIRIAMAHILPESCINCGKCLAACPAGAIRKGKRLKVEQSRCIGCGACFNVCPVHAIKLEAVDQQFIIKQEVK